MHVDRMNYALLLYHLIIVRGKREKKVSSSNGGCAGLGNGIYERAAPRVVLAATRSAQPANVNTQNTSRVGQWHSWCKNARFLSA